MIVVDASAVLEVLLNRPVASRVRQRLFAHGETLHAPHLIDLEVLQVIRRYHRTREMTQARAEEAIRSYRDIQIERYSHELLLGRIWQLRSNLTAYDAAYVALAELLGVPLATTDRRLGRSAARHVADLFQ